VHSPTSLTASLRRATTTVAAAAALTAALVLGGSSPELAAGATSNPVTPGPITGYGFDRCETPSQSAMTAWRKHSPFRAAGIYLSGSLRYCDDQPNLTATWVHTQLAAGWRLLPIHLGRQANCTTVARYQAHRISAAPTNNYAYARSQGIAEAKVAVTAAEKLGIPRHSTIFYDLESFDIGKSACRASALRFLGAWTSQLRSSGYYPGVYSSAATGIKMLDDARVDASNTVPLPSYIWIADWNDKRNTSSTYIRADGWPGHRLHQYHGGHNATYGGVTMNIDSNYLDLHGFPKCSPANINRSTYRYTTPDVRRDLVTPLQCMLKKNGYYPQTVTGAWNTWTTAAVQAFQAKLHHPKSVSFSRSDWVALLSAGTQHTVLKPGVQGWDVIRAQRALNAATSAGLTITGTYNEATQRAAVAYQKANDITPAQGIIASITWRYLTLGRW
jgi:peptidoglycan hydrolase-like protein with peptidoglycan-binding domain